MKTPTYVAVVAVWLMLTGLPVEIGSQTDVFARAGLEKTEVEEAIVAVLTGGEPPVYLFHRIGLAVPPAEQARWLQDAFAWARAYVAGQGFAHRYAAWREEHRPRAREPLQGAEAEIKAQQAEYQRKVAEMRESMKNMSPEMRRQMEATLKQMEASRSAMVNDKQMMAAMEQGIRMQNEKNRLRYTQDLADFEEKFPADPRPLLQRRLAEFVSVCDTVDFAARLREKDGLRRFVNPDFEAQTTCWKLIFRAGRERAQDVRALALAWLEELKQ